MAERYALMPPRQKDLRLWSALFSRAQPHEQL